MNVNLYLFYDLIFLVSNKDIKNIKNEKKRKLNEFTCLLSKKTKVFLISFRRTNI